MTSGYWTSVLVRNSLNLYILYRHSSMDKQISLQLHSNLGVNFFVASFKGDLNFISTTFQSGADFSHITLHLSPSFCSATFQEKEANFPDIFSILINASSLMWQTYSQAYSIISSIFFISCLIFVSCLGHYSLFLWQFLGPMFLAAAFCLTLFHYFDYTYSLPVYRQPSGLFLPFMFTICQKLNR